MSLFNDKLNSDYWKASALGRYVTVFVENEGDVPFWSRVLRKYAPDHLKFKVNPSSRNNLGRGKSELLKNKDGVGDFMLLCVDSDYDYLLQDTTADSQAINNSPYILQTYTYSVENYKCFADSLPDLCIQASLNDEPLFDFIEFLRAYSQVMFELFLYMVYCRKIGDLTAITIDEFPGLLGIQGKINIAHNAHTTLKECQTNVAAKVAALKAIYPDIELSSLATELAHLGVKPAYTYLFLHGHTVYANLVLPLLKSVVTVLRANKQAEFAKHAQHEHALLLQKQQEYANQILDIETLLAANTDYDACFLMQFIKADLENYRRVSKSGRAGTALAD